MFSPKKEKEKVAFLFCVYLRSCRNISLRFRRRKAVGDCTVAAGTTVAVVVDDELVSV